MSFHGVLGEAREADAETIAVLLRRLRDRSGLHRIKIELHGYDGCGQLLRKGAGQLRAWARAGCVRAVICYDADRSDPANKQVDRSDPTERRRRIEKEIIKESGVQIPCCPLVPVQEVEAWLLADIVKLQEIFHWCLGLTQHNYPESINDPKEHLIRLSRNPKTGKRPYHPPTHNRVLAELIDLQLVAERCPSFSILTEFVAQE